MYDWGKEKVGVKLFLGVRSLKENSTQLNFIWALSIPKFRSELRFKHNFFKIILPPNSTFPKPYFTLLFLSSLIM